MEDITWLRHDHREEIVMVSHPSENIGYREHLEKTFEEKGRQEVINGLTMLC